MLKTTSCRRIIFHEPTRSLVEQVQIQMADNGDSVSLTAMPSLRDVFPALVGGAEDVPLEPYPSVARPTDLNLNAFYIHSSGSTGYPKSIEQSYVRLLEILRKCTSLSLVLVTSAHLTPKARLAGPQMCSSAAWAYPRST